MAKTSATRRRKTPPKTRAQLKRQEEEEKNNRSKYNTSNQKERSKESEKSTKKGKDEETTGDKTKTGWTSIQDVEAKIRALQRQYDNAIDENVRSRVRNLLDKYEKQAKALIIGKATDEKIKKVDNNDKTKGALEEKNDGEQNTEERNKGKKNDEETNSNSSESTEVTSNSVSRGGRAIGRKQDSSERISQLTPQELNRAEAEDEKRNKKGVTLESIGTVRGSPTNKKEKKGTEYNKEMNKKKIPEVTQEEEEATIMSAMTKTPQKNKGNEIDNNKINEKKDELEKEEESKENDRQHNDDQTIMSECTKLSNEKKEDENENKENEDEQSENDATIMSDCTKEDNNQENKPNEETEEEQNKKETSMENPYKKKEQENKNKQDTYADMARKGNEDGDKVSETNNNNGKCTNKEQMRIRFTFVGRNFQGPKGTFIKEIIYEVLQCAKAIDTTASLMTWKEDDNDKGLNGDEIRLLTNEKIREYADIPPVDGEYQAGTTYYRNGVRLQMKMKISEFIDRWNFKKYDKGNKAPFNNWKAIKPAEMQKSAEAYPIGYMLGTTERGYYDTVKKQLAEEFDNRVEASFQPVYQAGISNKVWDLANETAAQQYQNKYSKNYKMIKFAMAPTALIIYTGDESITQELRTKFIAKYGGLNNGYWPIMRDKSRMRFVPIVKGYTDDENNKEKMLTYLTHQATSKAGEVKIRLDMKDITDEKEYLQGKSIEQILHEISTKEDKEIPLIKHLTTKWSIKYKRMEYEIAVAGALLDEATEVMRGLKNTLTKQYGYQVINHFSDQSQVKERTWKMMPMKRKYVIQTNEWDKDINDFFQNTSTDDKLSKILIEGMEKLTQQETNSNGERAIVFNEPGEGTKETGGKEEAKEEQGEKEKEIIEIDETETEEDTKEDDEMTELSEDDSYMKLRAWDEISIVGEFPESIGVTKDEKRKVTNTLDRYKIELCDIEQWKNKHWIKLEQLVKECEAKEYSVMKRIVDAVKKEREQQSKDEQLDDNNNQNEAITPNQGNGHPNSNKSPPQDMSESAGRGA